MFVDQFEHARATGTLGSYRRSPRPPEKPFYTRPQIRQYYEAHRRGELTGAAWDLLERDIIAASAEGRVAGAARSRRILVMADKGAARWRTI
jgi:hypothetical protein